jgi:putative mRNA 3-end processing factor
MIIQTDKGMFCASGGFHVDPTRAVEVAVITHAHSDHARRGSRQYLCAEDGVSLLKSRIGQNAQVTGVPYGKKIRLGKVDLSFHPAGHILGSAQARIESDASVWVVSGDYKREHDPTCREFEVVPCDTFITEATFGHPNYEWGETRGVFAEIHAWWMANREQGRNSLLFCYALGKTQRVLAELARFSDIPAYLFGEADLITRCYREQGISMLPTLRLEDVHPRAKLRGELIVAPHSITRSGWLERLGDVETAFASGWMSGGSTASFGARGHYDRGFPVSDHADWPALLRTIEETRAKQVLVQHASSLHLVKYLKSRGLVAASFDRPERVKQDATLQGELF